MNAVLRAIKEDKEGFSLLSSLLKQLIGINLLLNDKNLALMAGRLNPLLRKHGIGTYAEYHGLLSGHNPALLQEFVTAMTTNTTEFFREFAHFSALRSLVPKILARKRGNRELRVWCAAASTGQEPYSIAITLREVMEEVGPFDLRMLGTDIDTEVLEKAAQGIYSESEMAGVSPLFRQKYFSKLTSEPGNQFEVRHELRNSIRFAQFNLIQETYPFKYPFDVVFCRNVLIYFDRATGESVVEKLVRSLSIESYLFLGHSETGVMRLRNVENVSNAVYQRKL